MPAEARLLFLTPDFPPAPGGIQVLAHRLALHTERLDCRVVTLSSAGAEAFDRGDPLDVRRSPAGPGNLASNLLLNGYALREALLFGPDAVLSAHIVTSLAAAAIRRAARIPVVQYLHADEVRARPRLAAFAVSNADAVVAVSRYTEQLALSAGAAPDRVHRIPNGVDLPVGPAGERADQPTLLTVARMRQRYKGFDVVARALPLIRARVPDACWTVVGDGPLRGQVEDLAASGGVQEAVRLTGEVSDAERDAWLDRAHLFVMPSRMPASGTGGEGFGIVYLEAAAHGLPVVAGNVAGAPDAVVHGETGVLVDPTDHVAIADAVSDLLLDPERAAALGSAGAKRARQFAWPVVARRVEKLVLELVTAH